MSQVSHSTTAQFISLQFAKQSVKSHCVTTRFGEIPEGNNVRLYKITGFMKTTSSQITQMQFDFTTPKGQVLKKNWEGRTKNFYILSTLARKHLGRMWFFQHWAGCDFNTVFINPDNMNMALFSQRRARNYDDLYRAIENTANQNSGKPFYIRYSTQPSHRALRILFPPKFRIVTCGIFHGIPLESVV